VKPFLRESVLTSERKITVNHARVLILLAALMSLGAIVGGGAPPMGFSAIPALPSVPAENGAAFVLPAQSANKEAGEVVKAILLMLPPPASELPGSEDLVGHSA